MSVQVYAPEVAHHEQYDPQAVRKKQKLTSGGIAIAHIATPAMPPAKMTAPRLRSVEPGWVSMPFVTSYAAK